MVVGQLGAQIGSVVLARMEVGHYFYWVDPALVFPDSTAGVKK